MAIQATQLLLVVLDGASPNTWTPWNRAPLVDLRKQIADDEILLLDQERQRFHFRVTVLPHPPADLLARETSEMRAIVGVIVDGAGYASGAAKAGELRRDFAALCNKLAGAQQDVGCWYPKVGFYVLVATPKPPDAAYAQCRFDLEGIAANALGGTAFWEIFPVSGDDLLPPAVQDLEVRMYSRFKRAGDQALRRA